MNKRRQQITSKESDMNSSMPERDALKAKNTTAIKAVEIEPLFPKYLGKLFVLTSI